MGRLDAVKPFSELFNLNENELSNLVIKETNNKDNCYIYNSSNNIIGGFILIDKPFVKTIVNVTFHKSSSENKYLPRLEFRKVNKENNPTKSKGEDVIIPFKEGDDARSFWKIVQFLQGFKELVDLGDFQTKYQAITFDSYLLEFKSKIQSDKIKELISFAENTTLSNEDLKEIIQSQRKNKIHWFYAFLKNLSNKDGINVYKSYRDKNKITKPGEEEVWHHFLKNNEWIIGLNVDIKFIRDLLSEQKVGSENSKGAGSPKVDLLGISYFTSIIELKTSDTKIFKPEKTSKSRANTWDFSNDFIEAYSQVLAQRTSLTDNKKIEDEKGNILDNEVNRILDPKAILLIGNRSEEFPHNRTNENNIKSDCFERLRRDTRNVEILTYDELFERAYHIVYTTKLPKEWYKLAQEEFKKNLLFIK
jgi:hypothetical protein